VWTYPGASSLGSDGRRGLKDHPTVKPTAMLEDALLDLTNRGDIVVDSFLSSGSTLIAAATTGRVCRGLGGVDSWDSLLGGNQIQGCFWEAVLGVMDRLVLSDAAWERMAPLIIGRPDQKGSTGRDNRMFVEGVLWIVRTGSPWRDLPEAFGDWNSVFRRFSRWSIKGVWWRIFEAMSDDPDFEYLIVDSTIVRAHQHAAGAKKGGLKIRRSAARAVD
jgi:putative transposase